MQTKIRGKCVEMKRMECQGRPTGGPKTLADTLVAYCHLLSSLPAWLEAALVPILQNLHPEVRRGTSPTKTFGKVLVILTLVALASVARVRESRLPA